MCPDVIEIAPDASVSGTKLMTDRHDEVRMETGHPPLLALVRPPGLLISGRCVWPRLDRKKLTRTRGDPRRVARLLERLTTFAGGDPQDP